MSKTRPWTPHLPLWEWKGVPRALRVSAKGNFEERAAIMEYDAKMPRAVAEQRSYCLLVETLHEGNAFTSEQISSEDIIRQLNRVVLFQRNDAIGRCVMEGTWPKKRGSSTKEERETLIAAAML